MAEAIARFIDGVIVAIVRLAFDVVAPASPAAPSETLPDSATLVAHFRALRAAGAPLLGTTTAAPRDAAPADVPSAATPAATPAPADVPADRADAADDGAMKVRSDGPTRPASPVPSASVPPSTPTSLAQPEHPDPDAAVLPVARTGVPESTPASAFAAAPAPVEATPSAPALAVPAPGASAPPAAPAAPPAAAAAPPAAAAAPATAGTPEPEALRAFLAAHAADAPAPGVPVSAAELAASPVHAGRVDVGEFRALHVPVSRDPDPLTATWAALPQSPFAAAATGAPAAASASPGVPAAHAAPGVAAAPLPAAAASVTDASPSTWPALPVWPPPWDDAPPAAGEPLRARIERSWYV